MTLTSETRAPVRARPVRLQLSRKKGFDLQAHSRAVNGLPAVNVARPSRWGNPYKEGVTPGNYASWFRADVAREMASPQPTEDHPWSRHLHAIGRDVRQLAGRNLACWCALDAPCHADVLLELANGPSCEALPANESQNEGAQTPGGLAEGER